MAALIKAQCVGGVSQLCATQPISKHLTDLQITPPVCMPELLKFHV